MTQNKAVQSAAPNVNFHKSQLGRSEATKCSFFPLFLLFSEFQKNIRALFRSL